MRSNLDAEEKFTDSKIREALRSVRLIDDSESSSGLTRSQSAQHDASGSVPTPPEPPADEGDETTPEDIRPPGEGEDGPQHRHGDFSNLEMPISARGESLSQGQRQLVCLARAILQEPRIVVLDEATSSVDKYTDGVIQKSLREEFVAKRCTLLVIAHRLLTVADFDRILVLEKGRIAEIGTPKELLEKGAERMKGTTGRGETSAAGAAGAAAVVADENSAETASFYSLVQSSSEIEELTRKIHGEA